MTMREMPMGANVFWTPAVTDRQKLLEELTKIGLGDYTPCQRTEAASLKMALEEYSDDMLETRRARKGDNGEGFKRDKLVQSLLSQKEDGFEVVDVTRKQKGNDYVCDFAAKIIEGQVYVSRGYASDTKIQGLYDGFRATLGGSAVGGALVEIVKDLGGVSLKDSGGVYWLQPDKCSRWEEIIRAFEAAGPNKVYIMRTVMDAQTVRAVTDNITAEIAAASESLVEDIKANALGEQAIENRLLTAKKLHDRVRSYEAILGKTMEQLHNVISISEIAVNCATAIKEDSTVFDSLFDDALAKV